MYYSIRLYVFICDDCNSNDEFCDVADARANGWAISKNHDACYCPNCAPAHRNTGRGGVKNGVSVADPYLLIFKHFSVADQGGVYRPENDLSGGYGNARGKRA